MYENLKTAIESKGISKYRLAKLSNIHTPDLYQALNGKKPFYASWKKRIAAALEIPEEELFKN